MNDIKAQQIIDLYYADYRYFFSKPNVVGIAYGYKITKGIITYEPCIHVFVEKKVSTNCIPANGLIPPLYKGVKTDIIESGNFISEDSSCDSCILNGSYTGRVRPIQPGWCMSTNFEKISPLQRFTGTFSYIVTDNEQVSKTFCLLSVNKTFSAYNQYPIGGEILQPAYNYGGRPPQDIVGKLLRFTPLNFKLLDDPEPPLSEMNVIDASVASFVTSPPVELINPFIPPRGVFLNGITDPELQMPTAWTGCVTGLGSGPILSLNGIIKYTFPFRACWFKDVTLVSFDPLHNVLDSDAGALVTTTITSQSSRMVNALGLIIGRTNSSHIVSFCSIKKIQEMLNVTLLTYS